MICGYPLVRRACAFALLSGFVLILVALGLESRGMAAGTPEEEVRAMIRKVLDAPETTSRVLLQRSDPFGGPPEREHGNLWFLPGRGLRYRTEGKRGQDLVVDRDKEAFLLYTPSQRTVYRAPFSRAPARIRRLIQEPSRLLEHDLNARPEPRWIQGRARNGYRIRSGSLGDSLPSVTFWIAPDPSTRLPRWIEIASESDSLLVELQGLSLLRKAKPADLALSAPRGTPEEPMDPRELLRGERGESR